MGALTREVILTAMTTLCPSYDFGDELGRGAFGVVYKATPKTCSPAAPTPEPVAIKFIDKTLFTSPQARPYLEREMTMQREITHPNIVKVFSVHESDRVVALVMEHCETNLADHLSSLKRIPESTVRSYARQLTSALKVLYDSDPKIVHRDLKPSNVLMKEQRRGRWAVKISDFGFAKFLDSERGMLETQLGTPLFRAPEVIRNNGVGYGPKVDLWSLGAILYQLLTGEYHIRAQTERELSERLGDRNPAICLPATGGFSAKCCDLVRSLLTKDPARRISHEALFRHPFLMPVVRLVHVAPPDHQVKTYMIESGDLDVPHPSMLTYRHLLRNVPGDPSLAATATPSLGGSGGVSQHFIVTSECSSVVTSLSQTFEYSQSLPDVVTAVCCVPGLSMTVDPPSAFPGHSSDLAASPTADIRLVWQDIIRMSKACGESFRKSAEHLNKRIELLPALSLLTDFLHSKVLEVTRSLQAKSVALVDSWSSTLFGVSPTLSSTHLPALMGIRIPGETEDNADEDEEQGADDGLQQTQLAQIGMKVSQLIEQAKLIHGKWQRGGEPSDAAVLAELLRILRELRERMHESEKKEELVQRLFRSCICRVLKTVTLVQSFAKYNEIVTADLATVAYDSTNELVSIADPFREQVSQALAKYCTVLGAHSAKVDRLVMDNPNLRLNSRSCVTLFAPVPPAVAASPRTSAMSTQTAAAELVAPAESPALAQVEVLTKDLEAAKAQLASEKEERRKADEALVGESKKLSQACEHIRRLEETVKKQEADVARMKKDKETAEALVNELLSK